MQNHGKFQKKMRKRKKFNKKCFKFFNREENKSFLYHCYPDGNGPDSELINMMEKDVVELNPCVKFEDIAELEKAKEILQEAVLLPIMIPNFFKVTIKTIYKNSII